jgi:hypothetical protein
VELEIQPEPEPADREAITIALERLLDREALPAAYTSPWRLAGIAENVAAGRTAYATARPRKRPGATRA